MMVGDAVALALIASGTSAPAGLGSPTPVQSSVRLAPQQLLAFAGEAARRGDARTAEIAYRALASDADADLRAEAMFRLAGMFAAAGRLGEAAVLLRQVVDLHPHATAPRLELASVFGRMGNAEASYRELRAAEAAGLPPVIATRVRRYTDALRAARPGGFSIEIGIAPDTNINRSTRSDRVGTIIGDFQIDRDAKAKSGVGLTMRASGYRRLSIGDNATFVLRAGGSADLFAKTRFNDLAIEVAAGPELLLRRSRLALEVGAASRWLGQQPFVRAVRAGVSWTAPVLPRTQLRVAGQAMLLDNRLNELQNGKAFSLQGAMEHALTPNLRIGGSLTGDRLLARDPAYATFAWRGGLTGAYELGRASVTLGSEVGRLRADDRLHLLPERRRDRFSKHSVTIDLRNLRVGRFAPTLRLSVERNRSSISLYRYTRQTSEFLVQYAF